MYITILTSLVKQEMRKNKLRQTMCDAYYQLYSNAFHIVSLQNVDPVHDINGIEPDLVLIEADTVYVEELQQTIQLICPTMKSWPRTNNEWLIASILGKYTGKKYVPVIRRDYELVVPQPGVTVNIDMPVAAPGRF